LPASISWPAVRNLQTRSKCHLSCKRGENSMTRRQSIASFAAAASAAPPSTAVEKYVRYQHSGRISWGRVEGEQVIPLSAAPYLSGRSLGGKKQLKDVKLLAPADPPKVLAVGLNYKSHIGNRTAPKEPEIFY